MGRDWKPGDAAMVTWVRPRQADKEVIAFRTHAGDWYTPNFGTFDEDCEARPLLVIDPDDFAQVAQLSGAFDREISNGVGSYAEKMQRALRSLLAPPKPRCVAHGNEECEACSRIAGVDLSETGECRHCSIYGETGMHWDTCPGRIRADVIYPTRADALIGEQVQP